MNHIELLEASIKQDYENDQCIISPMVTNKSGFHLTFLCRKTREIIVNINWRMENEKAAFLSFEFDERFVGNPKKVMELIEKWTKRHTPHRLKIASGVIRFILIHNVKNIPEILPTLGIQYIDFNVRPFNVLKMQGYFTIKDMLTLNKERLSTFPNLGEKSICEILNKIDEFKLLI